MRMTTGIAALLATLMMPAMAGAQQSSSSSSQASAQSTQSSQSSEKTAQAAATAQVVTPKTESLAEAARKARAAEKNAPKAATVFTNDNLPTISSGVSVVGQASAASTSASTSAGPASSASSTTSAGSSDEAAWRAKFADARHKIEQDKQELAIMQREMGELNVQYYANPTKALMQSINRSDITKKQAAIDAKQKQLAADEQALSDLQDQLRKAGGDPGWARE